MIPSLRSSYNAAYSDEKYNEYRQRLETRGRMAIPFRLAETPAQLRDHLTAYLCDPSLDRAGRRALVELQVSLPVGSASRRAVETLRQIAAAPVPVG